MGKPQSKSPGSARAGSSSAEAKTAKKAAAPRPKKAAKEGAKKKAQDDVVLVHGRDENGGLHVLRKKGEELSAGVRTVVASRFAFAACSSRSSTASRCGATS